MVQLAEILRHPSCGRCGSGTLRPIDIIGGKVQIRCTTVGCEASIDIALPPLTRKIIYLDTSTVSHMARAPSGPYSRLRTALRDAVYKNVVGCVASSIVRAEAELLRDDEPVFALCRELGTIRAKHQLRIEEAQIYRAFSRFLQSEAPVRELRPPASDCFEADVQAWHGYLSFHSRFQTSQAVIDRRRQAKTAIVADFERIYGRYAAERLSFREIEKRETDGLCNFLCGDLVFYQLVVARTHRGIDRVDAERQVEEFLRSDHVRLLPFAVINGRLHAALARARPPKSGDMYDIEHLRTYVPYVDVLITDANMAVIANQGNMRIGQEYGTVVRSLGASEVDEFIAWLEDTAAANETAILSAQLYDSISAGGYFREFAEFATRYVARLKQGTPSG